MLRPVQFLVDSRERFGDTWTMRLAPERTVAVTCDSAIVKDVFTGPPDLLHAGKGNIVLQPFLGSRSVLLLDGAEHLRHRRLLLPPFHGERMRNYGDMMREVAERHVARWPHSGELQTAADDAGDHPRGDPARRVRRHRPRARRPLVGHDAPHAQHGGQRRGGSSPSPPPCARSASCAASAARGRRLRAELRPVDEMILSEIAARGAPSSSAGMAPSATTSCRCCSPPATRTASR